MSAGSDRQEDDARVGQTVADTNEQAVRLLTERGYEPRHTSWVLTLPTDLGLDRAPPAGVEIRPYRLGVEEADVYRVIEDAFGEWPTRLPSTREEWRVRTVARDDFDPSLLLVADEGGEIVGASVGFLIDEDAGFEGWVDQLAVRADRRGRGLGAALLSDAFGEMRRRGAAEVGLSTDSRTGALDLYLSLGMEVTMSFTRYSKLLRSPM